ncbi:diacylglycerol kinase family protein [Lactobacillaceae bacterium 24-114]
MALKDNHQTDKNHHLLQAIGHACEGIADMIKEERNMRFHVALALIAIVFGIIFQLSRYEWLWILLAIMLVFSAEFLNTVTELVTDLLVQRQYDINAKKAKDVAAGGVLITAIFAVLVGIIIFVPRVIELMRI